MCVQARVSGALATLAAARHVGVVPKQGVEALSEFKSVKRRMEKVAEVNGVTIYDDFAHHPTAVATTLEGLRARVGRERILAVLEPRSNTMKLGVHKDTLAAAFADADRVYLYQPPNLGWDLSAIRAAIGDRATIVAELGELTTALAHDARASDHVLIMSNGGFGGLHERLLAALRE